MKWAFLKNGYNLHLRTSAAQCVTLPNGEWEDEEEDVQV